MACVREKYSNSLVHEFMLGDGLILIHYFVSSEFPAGKSDQMDAAF